MANKRLSSNRFILQYSAKVARGRARKGEKGACKYGLQHITGTISKSDITLYHKSRARKERTRICLYGERTFICTGYQSSINRRSIIDQIRSDQIRSDYPTEKFPITQRVFAVVFALYACNVRVLYERHSYRAYVRTPAAWNGQEHFRIPSS